MHTIHDMISIPKTILVLVFSSSLKSPGVAAKSQNNHLKYAIPAYEEQELGVTADDKLFC